nr:putative methyltransferase pmt16 [Ipomoea batatas]
MVDTNHSSFIYNTQSTFISNCGNDIHNPLFRRPLTCFFHFLLSSRYASAETPETNPLAILGGTAETYPTTSIQRSTNGPVFNWDHRSKLINVFICSLRKLRSPSREPKNVPFILNPVLNGLLDRQALVRCIRIRNIISTLWPLERGYVSFRRWDKAMQLLFLRRTVPFSVDHIFPREGHSPPLILAWCVVGVARMTRLNFFHFRLRLIDTASSTAMMRLEIETWQDVAIFARLSHLQRYAVSLPEPTPLPRSQQIEETTETGYYKNRHRAPSPTITRGYFVRHSIPETFP